MAVSNARCDRNGEQPDDGRYGQREPDCSRVEPLGGKPDRQERHLHAENHAERRIKQCKSPRKRRGCGYLGMSGHESDCDSCSIVLIVNTHEHHAGRTVRPLHNFASSCRGERLRRHLRHGDGECARPVVSPGVCPTESKRRHEARACCDRASRTSHPFRTQPASASRHARRAPRNGPSDRASTRRGRGRNTIRRCTFSSSRSRAEKPTRTSGHP